MNEGFVGCCALGCGLTSCAICFRFCFAGRVNTNPSSSSMDCLFCVAALLAILSLDRRLLAGGEFNSNTCCFFVARVVVVLPLLLCGGVTGGESG